MIYQHINIESVERDSLKTEVRFVIASAAVDGVELIAIELPVIVDENDRRRMRAAMVRMLSALKREGRISFYVDGSALLHASTEAEFLVNKYGDHLHELNNSERVFLVKL